MAVTQEQIDESRTRLATLNQMIADGVRQVTNGDQTITYNTTDSLIRARDDLARQIGVAEAELAGQQPVRRRTLAHFAGRGYE